MSVSPNIKLVRNLAGEVYFQPEAEGPLVSLGHIENFTTNATATPQDDFTAISGTRVLADTDFTDLRVSGDAVLRETGSRQLAFALMAVEDVYTQNAVSGQIVSATVRAGETIDLGYTDVTISSITNAGGTAIAPDAYTLDAAAGMVTFRDANTVDILFSADDVSASDGRALLAGLSARHGRFGRIFVRQRQTRGGKQGKYVALVRMRPNGPVVFHDDSGNKVTLPIAFDVLEDTSRPVGKRHGEFIELAS